MLIKNDEKEFAHILNKKLKFDQLIIEFRNCGILLNPLDQDLEAYGYKVKVSLFYKKRNLKVKIEQFRILLWL